MNKLQFKKFYQILRIETALQCGYTETIYENKSLADQLMKNRIKTSKNNAIYKAMISADNLLKSYIDKDSRSLFLYGRYTKIFNY